MDFSEKYRIFLKRNLVSAKDASGNREIVARCKYCPDSNDRTHGHMYISIPQELDEISLFDCKKCHTSGLVNNRTLQEWGIYDPEIASQLGAINKLAIKRGKMQGYNRNVYSFNNYVFNQELANNKLRYLNDRLGTNISIRDAMHNKIIFNLNEVLVYNKVEKLTRHPNIISQLNDQFVGFLSLDNNFINLRRICDEGVVYQSIDKRYVNYNIHDKRDNTEKYYILPINDCLTQPRRLPIHIAEGPFDILSVFYNLRRDTNAMYAAIAGSGYKGLIMHILNVLKLFYIEFHFYMDNDFNMSYITDIAQWLKPYNIPICIHRNITPGEKDFGVPLNRISESVAFLR